MFCFSTTSNPSADNFWNPFGGLLFEQQYHVTNTTINNTKNAAPAVPPYNDAEI